MHAKISYLIIALLWGVAGISLIFRGVSSICSLADSQLIMFGVLISVIIGLLKGFTIFRKVAHLIKDRIEILPDTLENICLGWYKGLGLKGLLIIALMIFVGISLSYIFRWLGFEGYFGFIRLIIGIALCIGAYYMWLFLNKALKETDS